MSHMRGGYVGFSLSSSNLWEQLPHECFVWTKCGPPIFGRMKGPHQTEANDVIIKSLGAVNTVKEHCKGVSCAHSKVVRHVQPWPLARSPWRACECVHGRISFQHLPGLVGMKSSHSAGQVGTWLLLSDLSLSCSSSGVKVAIWGRVKQKHQPSPAIHHFWALPQTQGWKGIFYDLCFKIGV